MTAHLGDDLHRINCTRLSDGNGNIVLSEADYATVYALALASPDWREVLRASPIGPAGASPPHRASRDARALPQGESGKSNAVSPGYYQAPNGVSFHQIVDGFELDHWEANAVKYVIRGKRKGKPIEDLEKAIWCLTHKLALLKAALREEVQS